MKQPVAKYIEEDFERILRRDFPAEQHAEVRSALDEYGKQDWHRDQLRVRMACLKLASGDLARLRRQVQTACTDYRDVLAWAEYPNYMRARGPAEQQTAIEQDGQQLQAWLHR